MSFKHCPNCGGLLRAPDLKAGHAVRCNKCGYTFIVPDHVPAGHSTHRGDEREERHRRDRHATGVADAPRRKWVVPVLLLGGGLIVVVSGILVSGCWR